MDESLEQMQARHRKEQRELQARVTNKKKNATKKTRKFVNDECAELERQLKERQGEEVARLVGGGGTDEQNALYGEGQPPQSQPETRSTSTSTPVADLTSKLDSTTLSPSQSQPQPQPQEEEDEAASAPAAGKKRNRQKERLARRAAELEAAAVAAESEAAHMTDHRSVERAALQKEFAARQLREHEIAPDGHCLFAAVADQLATHGIGVGKGVGVGADMGVRGDGLKPSVQLPAYKVVRRAAAEWIAGHRELYEGFMEGGVDEYVGRIRDTAEWGGELELSALANAYGVEIRVVQGGRVEVVKPMEEKEGEGKTLWLAYYRHGYGLGEHYNSLRKEA
jgi:OTU domain-containing protein 6